MLKEKTKIFYALSFLGGLHGSIIASFFVIFGLSLGIDIARVGILFGVIRFTIFVFEIPTGIFADSYGRKKSILICYFLSIFFSLIYFFSSNFYLLLIGSIISGVALTFLSGAFEALVVDSLGLSDREQFRNKVFVRLGVITTLGFIAGGFAGSAIAYFNLRYIWLFQALVAILTLALGWKFLEEKFYPQEILVKRNNFAKTMFNEIRNQSISIWRNKKISLMFLASIPLSLASAFYLIGWPIVFKDILSIPVYYFGLISAFAGIFFSIGSLLAERLSLKKGTINTIIFSLILIGVFYIVFGLSKSIILSLISFIAIDFFNGGFTPLFYSLLNKFIPSSQRATILSFFSLTGQGSSGMGEIIAGRFLGIFVAPVVILLSPVLILVVLTLFLGTKIKVEAKE